jgi:hypothetical protein
MKTTVDSVIQSPSAQAGQVGREVLAVQPKSRLGWRLFGGILLEAISMIALLLAIVSGQFSWMVYALGVLSVLIPLGLLTWGFRLLVLDEAHAQAAMNGLEQRPPDGLQAAQLAAVSARSPHPEQNFALPDRSISQGAAEQGAASEREVALR